jgi:hypothetical protein
VQRILDGEDAQVVLGGAKPASSSRPSSGSVPTADLLGLSSDDHTSDGGCTNDAPQQVAIVAPPAAAAVPPGAATAPAQEAATAAHQAATEPQPSATVPQPAATVPQPAATAPNPAATAPNPAATAPPNQAATATRQAAAHKRAAAPPPSRPTRYNNGGSQQQGPRVHAPKPTTNALTSRHTALVSALAIVHPNVVASRTGSQQQQQQKQKSAV